MAGYLVVLEHSEGQPRRVSRELASTAHRLAGGPVTAVALGPGAEALAGEMGHHGVNRLLALDDARFAQYSSDGFGDALAALIRQEDPDVVLFPATAWGKDLAPRVSGLLGAGLVTDCTGLEADGDSLVAIRPVYAGKAFTRVRVQGRPALYSLRPNVQPIAEVETPCAVERPDVGEAGKDAKARVTAVDRATSETVELTEASIIVSGGRGMKAPENFRLLDELAAELGAAVGSSRPVADEGWVPHSYHVGQTGKVVSPDLYIAVGISGAIQHVAGISGSKYIVAINNDPDAPIFKVANYGIVGDLFQVVPALTEAIRAHKQSG
jgi:electron transfer flavoprotein alpha subunit